MSARGSITLSKLQGRLPMLDVACHRCERRGRVSLARLIEEHGADTGSPDLWEASRAIVSMHAQRPSTTAAPSIIPSFRRFSDWQKRLIAGASHPVSGMARRYAGYRGAAPGGTD